MSSNDDPEIHQAKVAYQAYWKSRACKVVILVNSCWFLTWALNLLTSTALLYIVLSICRVSVCVYWISTSVIGVIGVLFLGRRFRDGTLMTWRDGLVFLEDRLSLESTLSSAQDGAVTWPVPQQIPRLFQPRIRWFLVPLLAWGVAWQVQGVSASSVFATGEMPNRGKEIKETIDKIEGQQLVDPEELERLKQNMGDLATQGPEKWFSHESMEAMDGLNERLEAAIDANQQALARLEETFAALKNQPIDSPSNPGSELQQKMHEALSNLSSGALPLDPQLMKQLQELSNPTVTDSKAEKAMQALKGAQKGFESLKKHEEGSRRGAPGESKKDGKEEEGGGISRGPGEAPLNLEEKPPSMTSQSEVELESDNGRGDDADEVVDIIRRAPQAITPNEDSAGKEITSQNGTPATTWKDSLTPDEQETLKEVLR